MMHAHPAGLKKSLKLWHVVIMGLAYLTPMAVFDTFGIVTWQIDRNVNTTNVCVANCKFCNFFVPPTEKFKDRAYITDDETYRRKIEETFALGGDQLLLQGGHHPDLGIDYYESLFRKLKSWYPELRLHSLGPPEIVHISESSGLTYMETLTRLKAAGRDSRLPVIPH